MSRRLGDWHWILQAPIGSRQIIHTSHAVILYANIRQSQTTVKQRPLAIIWFVLHWESPGFVGIAIFSAINTRDASLHETTF